LNSYANLQSRAARCAIHPCGGNRGYTPLGDPLRLPHQGFPVFSDHIAQDLSWQSLPARQAVFQTSGGATGTSANVRVGRRLASVPPEKRASFRRVERGPQAPA